MRRNRFWPRFFAGVMTVWFGLVMAAPAILHSCPQAMATMAAAAETAEGHADHGAHHFDHQDKHGPSECRCLGSCAISAPAPLPAGAIVAMVVPAPVSPRAPLTAGDVPAGLTPDHAQPLATAPPFSLG